MKRMIAWMLALLMMGVSAAQAAEWPEGLSPAKPYSNEPEIDLNEKLGYMIFDPDVSLPVEHACQRLYIYLPREDVKAGEGTFYLLTEEDGEIWSTAMTNADAIIQRAISEQELDGLLWGGGTCFEILLPRTLELGKTYFVNMTRSCIVTEAGQENAQIGGADSWRFTVEGDYGVSGMTYRRAQGNGKYEEQILHPQPGDEIRFDLVLGGEAVMASLYQYGESVDFTVTAYTASGEIVGEVKSDSPDWGVAFLDAQGNILAKVAFN